MASFLSNYFPPSRTQWELAVWGFSLIGFTIIPLWFFPAIKMGKYSIESSLNINGRFGWFIMEIPGFITLWTVMLAVKEQQGIESLPRVNYLMASLYTIHYIYRAILNPLFLSPGIAPMHVSVAISAFFWNIVTGIGFGGWLGGYGPTTNDYWSDRMIWVQLGLGLWLAGFAGNIYHEEELRELRRPSQREQAAKAKDGDGKDKKKSERVYKIPQAGFFQFILYPHYFFEWIEWTGYWMIAGFASVPARNMILNEIIVMAPQAYQGKKWYINKFGKEKIGDRKAFIPGIL